MTEDDLPEIEVGESGAYSDPKIWIQVPQSLADWITANLDRIKETAIASNAVRETVHSYGVKPMAERQIQDLADFSTNGPLVEKALRKAFPGAHVVVEPGYLGRPRVKVVSSLFNGIDEAEKQDRVWTELKSRLGPVAETVSWVVVYGDDEL